MLDKATFCLLVKGLKNKIQQDNRVYDAFDQVGIQLNTDRVIDYMWDTVEDIFSLHMIDDYVDICMDYVVGEPVKIRNENGEMVEIKNVTELYNFIYEE
jgi:hypothetical protein